MKKEMGDISVRVVTDRQPYAIVDERIFRLTLCATARLILAWVSARPAGWTFRLGHMWNRVNITRAQWLSAKRELKSAGFFCQTRRQRVTGKGVLEWDNIFIVTADLLEKWDSRNRQTVEKKSGDLEF
jgi:hypothetical protein